MTVTTVDGYQAKIEYDEDIDLFRDEFLGLSGGANFYGKDLNELRAEFKKSLHVFLAVCKEMGVEPRRYFSGKFNLRIPPELHERLAIAAQAQGERINTLALEATLLESDGLSALHRSGWPSDGGAARLLPRFKITTISGRG